MAEMPHCSGSKRLSSDKSFVFAGALGAVALGIIAFSWAMNPKTVDLSPERIAAASTKTVIHPKVQPAERVGAEPTKTVTLPPARPAEQRLAEAPKNITLLPARPAEKGVPDTVKTVTLPPASSHLSAVLSEPSTKEDWLSVPLNKGALVLYIPRIVSDRVVVVRDEGGRPLDSVHAKAGLPFLRQYRLDVGTYQLNLKGFADVAVNIKAGKIATLQLSQDKVSVTHKTPPGLVLTEAGLEAYGPDIGPQDISSAEKTLYFAAELPQRRESAR
jgi:hypothetical protein